MSINNLLIGLAIGDAFGAGIEFQDRDWIKNNIDFSKFINVRHKIRVPKEKLPVFTKNYNAWDYTDDTEMTIGMINALVSKKTFSVDLLVKEWKKEYDLGILQKGHGRNGHGSMSWYYSGEKTIEEVREFQKYRKNPGNAPAMRAVPLGLIDEKLINSYAEINANATHPNLIAVISSQCIARASEYIIVKKGNPKDIIQYCMDTVELNNEYKHYFNKVEKLPDYKDLSDDHFVTLCGKQPIEKPYFLAGIKGLPSDSKFTTGSVLYILKNAVNAFDALKKAIYLGGDVDSVASITTGITAAKHGIDSLPNFMIENVEGKNYLNKIASKFENYINSK